MKVGLSHIDFTKPHALLISLTSLSLPVIVLAGFGNLPGDMVYFYTKQIFLALPVTLKVWNLLNWGNNTLIIFLTCNLLEKKLQKQKQACLSYLVTLYFIGCLVIFLTGVLGLFRKEIGGENKGRMVCHKWMVPWWSSLYDCYNSSKAPNRQLVHLLHLYRLMETV